MSTSCVDDQVQQQVEGTFEDGGGDRRPPADVTEPRGSRAPRPPGATGPYHGAP